MRFAILTGTLCLFLVGFAFAHPGIGIVSDSKGNVYYTDLVHVWKVSTDGTVSIAVKDVHTHELFIDENDDLYGEHEWYNGETVDTWGNYVWCLKSDGTFVKVIDDIEGFLYNTTLVRDSAGASFWAKKSGEIELLMKTTKNAITDRYSRHRFDDIRWIYVSLHDGNVYVVDNLQLKRVAPSGTVTTVSDDLKEGWNPFSRVRDRHYVYGMWTDTKKNVYVAVYGAKKVVKFTPNGTKSTFYESEKGWSPCGGHIARDGTQWIMEFSGSNKCRVVKLNRDGTKQVFQG